jgi:MFS transporter, putative signal transducer
MTRPFWLLAPLFFAQGLAPALTGFAIPILMRKQGIPVEQIGLTTLLFWPSALRFLVGPLIDRLQTRANPIWAVVPLQCLLVLAFLTLSIAPIDKNITLTIVALAALNLIATVLDVALEIFSVRILKTRQFIGSSAIRYVSYYGGGILAGGAFISLQTQFGWQAGVMVLALLVAISIIAAIMLERSFPVYPSASRQMPWRARSGRNFPPLVVLAVLLDLPQNVGVEMIGPYLMDALKSPTRASAIAGGSGLIAACLGAIAAGFTGNFKRRDVSLLGLAMLQAIALLPLAWLATLSHPPPDIVVTGIVTGVYGAAGAFNVALFGWLMTQVNPARAATQMGLLGSAHALSYVVAGPVAGASAGNFGFPTHFFIWPLIAVMWAAILWPLVQARSPLKP